MKVSPLNTQNQTWTVKEKKEADQEDHRRDQGHSSEKEAGDSFEEKLEKRRVKVSDETVEQAMTEFIRENEALGLGAKAVGSGPGLKVLLKDSSGGVIRRLTGEEFLRLRQSLRPAAGKILDRKA